MSKIANDADLIAAWLTDKAAATTAAYREDAVTFRTFTGKPLRDVVPADLEQFAAAIARAGGAPATVRRKVRAIKSLLAFGHVSGALPRHAGAGYRVPAGAPVERPVPSRVEVERVLRLCDDVCERRLIQTLYVAGLRAQEAAWLRKRDLRTTADGPAIATARRVVRVPASLYLGLLELGVADPSSSVFGLSARQVARVVKKRAIAAGLPADFTADRLRAAHRVHALDRGAPIAVICRTLGERLPIAPAELLHDDGADSSALYLL